MNAPWASRARLNYPSLGIWSTSLIQVLSVIYSQRSTSHMHIGQPQECRHLGFFALPYRVINLTNAYWSTSQMHAFMRLTTSQPHQCMHPWGWPQGQPHKCMHLWGWQVRLTGFILSWHTQLQIQNFFLNWEIKAIQLKRQEKIVNDRQ